VPNHPTTDGRLRSVNMALAEPAVCRQSTAAAVVAELICPALIRAGVSASGIQPRRAVSHPGWPRCRARRVQETCWAAPASPGRTWSWIRGRGSAGSPRSPRAAAAKAALESFTRSWAMAFGGHGIRVNTIAPGSTRTDSVIETLGDKLEQLGSATPLGRTADPSEIAEAIVFLASPQASYITGASVMVDGGYTAT
jgi:NAD(P)-dependent dehydrogenase (short-subunit alcohol dehydrogenase family)